jgi:hypothetical protein
MIGTHAHALARALCAHTPRSLNHPHTLPSRIRPTHQNTHTHTHTHTHTCSYVTAGTAWHTTIDWSMQEAGWSSPGFTPGTAWSASTSMAATVAPRALSMPLSVVLDEVQPTEVVKVGNDSYLYVMLFHVHARAHGMLSRAVAHLICIAATIGMELALLIHCGGCCTLRSHSLFITHLSFYNIWYSYAERSTMCMCYQQTHVLATHQNPSRRTMQVYISQELCGHHPCQRPFKRCHGIAVDNATRRVARRRITSPPCPSLGAFALQPRG